MNDHSARLFDALSDERKTEFETLFEARHREIEACGIVLKHTTSVCRQRGWKTHEVLWNAALFLNTVSHDHSVVLVDLVWERDQWKRSMHARTLALLTFEIGEDIPSVFGRKFRESIHALGVPSQKLKPVENALKRMKSFFKEHHGIVREIRTVAAAHRDHDAVTLHDTIEAMDLFQLITIGTELGGILNDLGKATGPLIDSTSGIKPPEIRGARRSK